MNNYSIIKAARTITITYTSSKITKKEMESLFCPKSLQETPHTVNNFVLRKTGLVVEFNRLKAGFNVTVNGKEQWMTNRQALMLFDEYRRGSLLINLDTDDVYPVIEVPAVVVLSNGVRKTTFTIHYTKKLIVVNGDGYISPTINSLEAGLKSIRDHKIMGHYRVA